MQKALLLSSTFLGLALSAPAMAQGITTPGGPPYGPNPYSTHASNIGPADTHSRIAPQLPTPAVGPNATVAQYLGVARSALAAGQTGLAQASLEDAETLALTRPVQYSAGSTPSNSPLVTNIQSALRALGNGDLTGAGHYTEVAMQEAGT